MPGTVREDALARLTVVRTAAAQIAADRRADHHRARPGVARSIAHHRHLVADLHHRRPDVVEELDLDDRLQPARRHPDGAADDVRFGERRVEDAIVAEQPLQAVRQLEDAALARHDRQRVLLARVRDVLAEDDDARVARHLVLQRAVDRRDHRVRLAFGVRRRVEGRGRRDRRPASRPTARRVLFDGLGAASACSAASFTSRSTVGRDRGELVVGRQAVRSSGTR